MSGAAKLGKRLPVLIEVKLSPEETKAGLDPESAEAAQLLEALPGFHSPRSPGPDDHRAVGRAGRSDPRLLPQPAHVARPLGRSASATQLECSPWA